MLSWKSCMSVRHVPERTLRGFYVLKMRNPIWPTLPALLEGHGQRGGLALPTGGLSIVGVSESTSAFQCILRKAARQCTYNNNSITEKLRISPSLQSSEVNAPMSPTILLPGDECVTNFQAHILSFSRLCVSCKDLPNLRLSWQKWSMRHVTWT